jgi:hypothetical protein
MRSLSLVQLIFQRSLPFTRYIRQPAGSLSQPQDGGSAATRFFLGSAFLLIEPHALSMDDSGRREPHYDMGVWNASGGEQLCVPATGECRAEFSTDGRCGQHIENFCWGLANAALVAFLTSVCDQRFSATQYALLRPQFQG